MTCVMTSIYVKKYSLSLSTACVADEHFKPIDLVKRDSPRYASLSVALFGHHRQKSFCN